jgi:serine protease inhibitor
VIPRANITAWRAQAPWPSNEQVEQDLVLSRALVATIAATEVEMETASDGEPEPVGIEVRFDHPFLVLLQDTEENTLIFLGKVEDPTKK